MFAGCSTIFHGNSSKHKSDAITLGDTLPYRQTCCNFISRKGQFVMVIVDYAAGCSCGVLACASNCIGISNGDTLRVLSGCNDDASFYPGEVVRIIPDSLPPDINQVHIPSIYSIDFVRHYYYTDRLNTIWGAIKHM